MNDPLPTSAEVETAIKMVGGALESLHHDHEGVPAAEAKRMAAVALGKVCSAVEAATRKATLEEVQREWDARAETWGYKALSFEVWLDTKLAGGDE